MAQALGLLLLALAARPAEAQVYPPAWGEVHGLRFAVVLGTTECPADTVPVGVEFARDFERISNNGLCDLIGDAGSARLADGGAMGGKRFGCPIEATGAAGLPPSMVCVTYAPPPRAQRRLPREIYPGGSGKVLELVARSLDGKATPLARVYMSGSKPPSGWSEQRMQWDAVTDGGAVWVPDGKQPFQLEFVAERDAGALPELSAAARHFTNIEPVPWQPCTTPTVPQYLVSELGATAGMSVLPDGTLRFFVESKPTTRTGTMMESATKPATFVRNTDKVLGPAYAVDDRVTDAGSGGSAPTRR